MNVAVIGGRVLDVTVAQYYTSQNEGDVEVEVHFHGLVPDSRAIALDAGAGYTQLHVAAPLQNEAITPAASLTRMQYPIRPASFVVRPLLRERDVLPPATLIHALELVYEFKLDADCDLRLYLSTLTDLLYENPVGAQLLLLFCANTRRYMGCSEGYPRTFKLQKGSYVARVQIRHPRVATLEQFTDTPLTLDRSLPKSGVPLTFYASRLEV